jgi:hypothetical protein
LVHDYRHSRQKDTERGGGGGDLYEDTPVGYDERGALGEDGGSLQVMDPGGYGGGAAKGTPICRHTRQKDTRTGGGGYTGKGSRRI